MLVLLQSYSWPVDARLLEVSRAYCLTILRKCHQGLAACAKSGGIGDIVVLGFEAVEAPDEGEFEVTGHVADFHTIVLSGSADSHCRRPTVEDVISFKVEVATTRFAKLPFHADINFPHCR